MNEWLFAHATPPSKQISRGKQNVEAFIEMKMETAQRNEESPPFWWAFWKIKHGYTVVIFGRFSLPMLDLWSCGHRGKTELVKANCCPEYKVNTSRLDEN